MSRFQPPSESDNRRLSPLTGSRGKKHFWGQKMKNYGFYTTNQELDMQSRQYQHLRSRIKSQISDYQDFNNNYIDSNRSFSQAKQRAHTLGNVQHGESNNAKSFRINPKLILNDTLRQVERHHHPKQMKLNSKFIDIKLPAIQKNQSYQTIQPIRSFPTKKQQRTIEKSNQFDQSNLGNEELYESDQRYQRNKNIAPNQKDKQFKIKIKQSDQSGKKQANVFVYQPRNKKYSPTYCNSFAYPLPCYYRYI